MKKTRNLNAFSRLYYTLLASVPTAAAFDMVAPWGLDNLATGYLVVTIPGLFALGYKFHDLLEKPNIGVLTSKKEDAEEDSYALKDFLDYQFLADLEHEFEVPHSSHSLKACLNPKCVAELRELDAIVKGEDPKPVMTNIPQRRNIFMTPNEARAIGYASSDVVGRRNMDLPLEVQSYRKQAAKYLSEKERLAEWTAKAHKDSGVPTKFYPIIDTALREEIEYFYGPGVDYEIENIYTTNGGVINQKITTPDGSFMRVAWDRWLDQELRRQKRKVELAQIEEERKLEERIKNSLYSNKAPIVLPPESGPIITPIAPVPDPDILEPEVMERLGEIYEDHFGEDLFGQALQAMRSYHGHGDDE